MESHMSRTARNSAVSFGIFGALVLILVSLTMTAKGVADACPDIPAGGNLHTLQEFAKSDKSCGYQIPVPYGDPPAWDPVSSDLTPSGGFVKTVSSVMIDGEGHSSGTCEIRLSDGFAGCYTYGTEMRYMNKIVVHHQLPSLLDVE